MITVEKLNAFLEVLAELEKSNSYAPEKNLSALTISKMRDIITAKISLETK